MLSEAPGPLERFQGPGLETKGDGLFQRGRSDANEYLQAICADDAAWAGLLGPLRLR